MRFLGISKPVSVIVGISLCSVTGYLLYLLFNKRDDEDDEFSNTFLTRSKHKTVKLQVPKDVIRILIGRNGKTIKFIQEESKTKIKFEDENEQENLRTCAIRGSNEGCVIATNLILELIEKQPVVDCSDIWVPQTAVGRIIGRCGEQIMNITSKSGAKVNVSDGDRSGPSRRITIKGTTEQLNIAKSLIEEIVQQSEKVQLKIDSTLSKREPRGTVKPTTANMALETPREEKLLHFPGQPDSQFEVYVSAMLDPSRFWVQIVSPKATQLDQLVDEMTDYYGKSENRELHQLSSVECGDLVAAIFNFDGKWYRAEVLRLVDSKGEDACAELYYVDYGDTEVVKCRDMYELRTDFLRLNFQAIECYLAGVEPIEGGENWSDEAKDKFEEWSHVAQWKKLSARMNGYCVREKARAKREGSPVPGIDLYDVVNDHDVDIAQELVNLGLATFKKDVEPRSKGNSTGNGVGVSNGLHSKT